MNFLGSDEDGYEFQIGIFFVEFELGFETKCCFPVPGCPLRSLQMFFKRFTQCTTRGGADDKVEFHRIGIIAQSIANAFPRGGAENPACGH